MLEMFMFISNLIKTQKEKQERINILNNNTQNLLRFSFINRQVKIHTFSVY